MNGPPQLQKGNQSYLYELGKHKQRMVDLKKQEYLAMQDKMIQDRPTIDQNSKRLLSSVEREQNVHQRLYAYQKKGSYQQRNAAQLQDAKSEVPASEQKAKINNFIERSMDSVLVKQNKINDRIAKNEEEMKKMFRPQICDQSKKIANTKGGPASFEALY